MNRDCVGVEPTSDMGGFESHLSRELAEIRQQGLWRTLRRLDSPQGAQVTVEGKRLLNFSSNDYLGLANHPSLKEAAIAAHLLGMQVDTVAHQNAAAGSVISHEYMVDAIRGIKNNYGLLLSDDLKNGTGDTKEK